MIMLVARGLLLSHHAVWLCVFSLGSAAQMICSIAVAYCHPLLVAVAFVQPLVSCTAMLI